MRKFIFGVAGLLSGCLLAVGAWADECNVAAGARLFQEQQCAGCHTYVPDDYDKSGPNLAGLFGRRAATVTFPIGFSPALQKSGIVWNDDTLDRWLTNPAALVPGTAMPFAGLADEP